jgi:hypothetical protein
MGEKGIGRLAIAIIGSQVLILTRAKRPEGVQDLVAAFIHWGMFELPGVDLDQIEIPMRVFPGGIMPSQSDVSSMLDDVRQNLEKLKDFVAPKQRSAVLEDLDKFDIDPKRYDGYLLGPALSGDGHGTHFYILPASEILESDLAQSEDNASRMAKTLLGFTNTMSLDHPPPPIKTAFRDHTTPETYDDVVETFEFFVSDEFLNADHYIKGEFDERGQFKGTVTVFGTEHKDHVISWKGQSEKN